MSLPIVREVLAKHEAHKKATAETTTMPIDPRDALVAELLTALKRLVGGTAGPGSISYEGARQLARAAIAKAEGRS